MKAELMKFIQKYSPVTDEQAGILADYALATWQPLPSEVKYLHITGGPGTGKTILGTVMGAICKNPLFWDAGFTHIALLQALDLMHPCTTIIGMTVGHRMEELWTVLKSGLNFDTSAIIRLEASPKAYRTFRTFGHKILIDASLPNDNLIKSRCIGIQLGVGGLPLEINFIDPNTFMDHFRADAEVLQFVLQEEFGALA